MHKSIETILKYIEDNIARGQKTMYLPDVYKLFIALNQCENNNQNIVGVGYKRYDSIDYKDTSLSDMLEGGFAVEPKYYDMKYTNTEIIDFVHYCVNDRIFGMPYIFYKAIEEALNFIPDTTIEEMRDYLKDDLIADSEHTEHMDKLKVIVNYSKSHM